MGAGIVEVVGSPGVGKSYVLKKLRVFRVQGTCNVLAGLAAVILYYGKCRHNNACYLYMARHIYERTARSAPREDSGFFLGCFGVIMQDFEQSQNCFP